MPGYRFNILASALLLACAPIFVSTPARAAEPAGSGKSADAKWGSQDTLIPTDKSGIILGLPGVPVCLVSNEVVELASAKPTGVTLKGLPDVRNLHAFSPDGKYLAWALKSPGFDDTPIRIWDLTTGQLCTTITGAPKQYLDYLGFCGANTLVTSGRAYGRDTLAFALWDPKTGKKTKTITTSESGTPSATISPDGKYLASAGSSAISIFDVSTGRTVAKLLPRANTQAPNPTPRQNTPAGRFPNRPDRFQRPEAPDMSRIAGMAFSPDGKELAALFDAWGARHICVWNTSGKLVMDISPKNAWEGSRTDQAPLQWAPDSQSWLIYQQYIIDRVSQKPVLKLTSAFSPYPELRYLSKDKLLCVKPGTADPSQTVEIPWDEIRTSLAAMEDPEIAAVIRPNLRVSIFVDVKSAKGSPEKTQTILTEAVIKKLQRLGLQPAIGQNITFNVHINENPGEVLKIVERNSPFDFRGHETGQSAQRFSGTGVFEIKTKADPNPVYAKGFNSVSSLSYNSDINDEVTHQSMVDNMTYALESIDLPYFLPVNPDLMALPATITIP